MDGKREESEIKLGDSGFSNWMGGYAFSRMKEIGRRRGGKWGVGSSTAGAVGVRVPFSTCQVQDVEAGVSSWQFEIHVQRNRVICGF